MRFVMTVIDADHVILTAAQPIKPMEAQQVTEAFNAWKARGGVLVIGDCLTIDRHGVEVDLMLPGRVEVRSAEPVVEVPDVPGQA